MKFPWLVGRYSGYLLIRQHGGTPYVNPTQVSDHHGRPVVTWIELLPLDLEHPLVPRRPSYSEVWDKSPVTEENPLRVIMRAYCFWGKWSRELPSFPLRPRMREMRQPHTLTLGKPNADDESKMEGA